MAVNHYLGSFNLNAKFIFFSNIIMAFIYKGKGRARRVGRKRFPSKRKVVVKALQKRSDMKIAKVVKKVLGRTAETKVIQIAGSMAVKSVQAGTTQTQFDAQCVMITPQGGTISAINQPYAINGQGIGQDQHTGDEIKIKGQYINYLAYPQPYNATFNPVPAPGILFLFVVKPKIGNANGILVTSVQASVLANLFENQFNTDSGLAGNLLDMVRKIDRDNWQVVAIRQHKLGYAGNLNTSNQLSTLPNNDFPAYIKGRFKVRGRNLKFDRLDRAQEQPYYMFAHWVRADNVAIPASHIPLSVEYNIATYYTDM